jgi:hypothetical protein
MKNLSDYTLDELADMTATIQQTLNAFKHVTDNAPTKKFINKFDKFKLELDKEIQKREDENNQ